MTAKMYMMSYYISVHMASSIMKSSDAWLTSLIPSRLVLCNARHICLYCFHWIMYTGRDNKILAQDFCSIYF